MMQRSWLVQRLLKPTPNWEKNPFNFGAGYKFGGLNQEAMDLIKVIFAFDYMGAAEFEHGSIPEALNMIAKSAENHTLIKGSFKPSRKYKKIVYYICSKDHEENVKDFIKSLLSRKHPMLKESTLLDASMEDKNEFARKYCGWLELDNGFFFFTDKEMFENTCKLFGI